jgi:hypothetical protein
MSTDEALNLVGPCGIYCAECECHKSQNSPRLLEYLVSRGIPRDRLPCSGCRSVEGNCPVLGETCETYTCAAARQVQLCSECGEFPCGRFNPAADRADVLPHNLKVFNLTFIEKQGLEAWKLRYPEIKDRYYRGRMVVGKGPQPPS